MDMTKKITKRLRGVSRDYHRLRQAYRTDPAKGMTTEDIFIDVLRRNEWGGKDSISGSGSDRYQTRLIIGELPILFKDFNISTFLDIPCGDFHWMSVVNLDGVNYLGGDIVNKLICNNKRFEKPNVRFRHLNIITDGLPKADLIMCRDCFVHFSFYDIFRALNNVCNSSKYLLTTTFTALGKNRDIFTGQWRCLNFEADLFNFPKPVRLITEGCTQGEGAYSDKSLGLWRVEHVKKCLENAKHRRWHC